MAVKTATAPAKAGSKAAAKDAMAFSFADTIAGYVKRYDRNADAFTIETSDGREFTVGLTDTTNAQLVRNLGEPYADATAQMRDMLVPGRYMFTYGVFYPEGGDARLRGQAADLPGRARPRLRVREAGLVGQADLADGRLLHDGRSSPTGEPNWREYRVGIDMTGNKIGDRQETDTISRLIYGLSTAYHMTGEDRFLEAAEAGVEYLREHLRNVDSGEGVTYWYHAIEIDEPNEKKILASEFGDDYQAIPAYEQIYALVGPAQVFRITGDKRIQDDIDTTISLFERFFYDPELRRLLVAPRPDLVRRQERRAGPQPGAQELELGRRPHPGLPDQRLAGHRRGQVRSTCSSRSPTRSSSASRTTRTARSSRSGSTRTGATT